MKVVSAGVAIGQLEQQLCHSVGRRKVDGKLKGARHQQSLELTPLQTLGDVRRRCSDVSVERRSRGAV